MGKWCTLLGYVVPHEAVPNIKITVRVLCYLVMIVIIVMKSDRFSSCVYRFDFYFI